MPFRVYLIQFILLVVLCPAWAATEQYGDAFSARAWTTALDPLHCRLAQEIPNYGEAAFVRTAGGQLQFVVRMWGGALRSGTAELLITPTPWQHEKQTKKISDIKIETGEEPFKLPQSIALRLLSYLSSGWQASIRYQSEVGTKVMITVSPVSFHGSYQEFLKCGAQLLPFTPLSVQWMVLHFDEDAAIIKPTAEAKLKRIVMFADRRIEFTRLIIKGYSDDFGQEEHNMRVSVNRAMAVKSYLVAAGIPVEKN